MITLGIETSCDETAAGVTSGRKILSNVVLTQAVHAGFGGVVPEIASREHTRHVVPIVDKAIRSAGVEFSDINLIAVTRGPGLVGCLLVGVSYARSLGLSLGVPVIGVNHLEGHISAVFSEPDLKFPLLCLIASGGHTSLVLVRGFRDYSVLGKTRDDAAGEAFDKVAKLLGLDYPGGAKLDNLAESGDPDKFVFPKARLKEGKWDFSFSGIKTAVALKLKELSGTEFSKADIAAGFRKAAVSMLISRISEGIEYTRCRTFAIVGGVAQCRLLREEAEKLSADTGINCYYPEPVLCGDNGAMIALAGQMIMERNGIMEEDFDASPYLPLL